MYNQLHFPIFAIDTVNGLAVDFNTAPGLKHTGIEDKVTPATIYELFTEFVAEKGADNCFGLT
jgi:hypothetical protein